MSETRTRSVVGIWIYRLAFLLNGGLVFVGYIGDDLQGMVLHGFAAALWFRMAEREAGI